MICTTNINNKIFYDKNFGFNIYPNIDEKTVDLLRSYIETAENTLCEHNSLFWKIDQKQHIIVDEEVETTGTDIFHQAIQIFNWLYERNYRINGHFYFRIGNTIEYISVSHNSQLVKHYIFVDKVSINILINANDIPIDIEEQIMADSINKINNYVALAEMNSYLLPAVPLEHSENKQIVESISDRVGELETKVKLMKKVSKNTISIISMTCLFTIGAIMVFKKINE